MMLNDNIKASCELSFVGIEDEQAQIAFKHSSAHILGSAIEKVFHDPLLTTGPPTKDGFFYDFYSERGEKIFGNDDYKNIEKEMAKIVNQNYEFERLYLSKEQALDLFSYNKFKVELIEKKVQDGQMTSVFKIGDFVDLCTGPHIPSTKYAQAMKIVKNS